MELTRTKSVGEVIRSRVERIIVENEMLRAGFAALPYVVLRDKTLSVGARLTYAVLLSYAWQEDATFVGQEKMGKDMGISERHLRRFLAELKDHRYIDISREDRRFNNTYIIRDVKTKLKAKKTSLRGHGRPLRPDNGVRSGRTRASDPYII